MLSCDSRLRIMNETHDKPYKHGDKEKLVETQWRVFRVGGTGKILTGAGEALTSSLGGRRYQVETRVLSLRNEETCL